MSGAPFQGGTFGEHVFSEVLVNKSITADAGSYAVTGTDATLRYGYKVVPDSGSYAVTGTDAATLHKWKFAAAADSYAVGGTDSTPKKAWKITAENF